MAIQTVNLGTAPSGAGGDTFRSTGTKINENFTDPTHAASRMVGSAPGNVMEVGVFGFGSQSRLSLENPYVTATADQLSATQMISFANTPIVDYGQGLSFRVGQKMHCIVGSFSDTRLFHVAILDVDATTRQISYSLIRTSANTTVDNNGFIKAASPIVQLFADRIELNDEAKLQQITFDKLGIGDYLVKGSTGFAQEGWYVETPKDANGNVLFSVIYDTLENGDISVKTYEKKFDLKTASIVADLDKPVDITTGRWIDIRLQELPKPEINHENLVFESATPPDFQPTNLARAVSEAFKNDTE